GNGYTLTASSSPALTGTTSASFNITKRPITVTAAANSRVYNGTTAAAATPSITSGALVPGDTANFSESYANKNVGTGKVLAPTGSVNDGNAGANYLITFVNSTSGVISPRTLTISAMGVNKVYDGNA